MEIAERLFLVGSGRSGVGLTHHLDCNVYLIDGGGRLALIDAGVGLEPQLIERRIARHGYRLDRETLLLLTHAHADHCGGALRLRQCYGLKVACSKEEAGFLRTGDEAALGLDVARRAGYYPADYHLLPTPVDIELADGDGIRLGEVFIRAVHTPGHSVGGLSFLCEIQGRKAIFVGDLLAHGGLISLQNIPGVDIRRYSDSVMRLEGLNVDMFMPGHGLFSLSQGQYHIDKAAAAFRQLGVPPNAV